MTDAVDWAVLRDLAEQMGDDEIAAMVLDAYRGELPARRGALVAGLTGEPEQLRDAVHALKASSLTIGATRLGELCRDAELLVVRGDLDAARATAGEALTELDRVADAITAGPDAG